MEISCSKCKSRHSLPLGVLEIDQLVNSINSIITCRTCGRTLSVAACPHCRAMHTVTFPINLQDSYIVHCIKCREEFTIYSAPKNTLIKSPSFSGPHDTKSKQQPLITKKASASTDVPGADRLPQSTGNALNNFTFLEFFKAAKTAFSASKIFAAIAGIIIMGGLLIFATTIENAIQDILPARIYVFLRSFISLSTISGIFFAYIITSSIISRITIKQIYISDTSNRDRPGYFPAAEAFLIFIAALAIPAVIKILFTILGAVPIVKPEIFAFIFLPIYCVSFFLAVSAGTGFWFFPSIISMRMAGEEGRRNSIIAFIRKNNFSLLYTILILTIITAFLFWAVFILHRGIFTLAASIGKQYIAQDALSIFSAMPTNFLGLTTLPFSGSDIGAYKALVVSFITSDEITAIALGTTVLAASLGLFSLFISVTSSLATHVYILLERGIDADNSKKISFFLRMLFVLAVLLAVRKIIA